MRTKPTTAAAGISAAPGAPEAADPAQVANRLRLSITRLARILRHQSVESLPPTLSAALATLERDGELTLGELAAREHVAPPTTTKAVEKLERLGFVTRRADEVDRRVARVRITTSGRRLVTQNRSRRTAWLATRLDALPAADVAQLAAAADILERLVESAGEELG